MTAIAIAIVAIFDDKQVHVERLNHERCVRQQRVARRHWHNHNLMLIIAIAIVIAIVIIVAALVVAAAGRVSVRVAVQRRQVVRGVHDRKLARGRRGFRRGGRGGGG